MKYYDPEPVSIGGAQMAMPEMRESEYGAYARREDVETLRDQLRRIIEQDTERNNWLRGDTRWHPYSDQVCFSSGWLAWREVEGGREILVYNNALCDPIYIAFQPTRQHEAAQQGVKLTHGRCCSAGYDLDADCTCGLQYRIYLQTEQEMHAAWRKRAEEAEAALAVANAARDAQWERELRQELHHWTEAGLRGIFKSICSCLTQPQKEQGND